MPHYSSSTKTNEELGPKYALNRSSSSKFVSHQTNDEIFSSKFHISENLNKSKQWFEKQKITWKYKNVLFEDLYFPAVDNSIFYSKKLKQNIEWKRPKEICANPHFISNGISRFDVQQGEIGDCWLLAALSSLSLHQTLYNEVVPEGQDFNQADYIGAFLFRFWSFGTWIDIVVDDRLPTYKNNLIFLHSADSNEFWSALLEKAYAKLASSYEALRGGSSSEAMIDFTGGITETFRLGPLAPNNLWEILLKADKLSSLIGCSVECPSGNIDDKDLLGLIKGHAYSITDLKTVIRNRKSIELIRIRNPWGNQYEWKGAWSDNSEEWKDICDSERQRLGLTLADDGEFWMCFSDFSKYFEKLEICHLSPESEIDKLLGKKRSRWEMCVENGEWQKNVSAGGCRNYQNTFHMNPQFRVNVTDPDDNDNEDMGTLIIGLMQKEIRSRLKEGQKYYNIGYSIYHIKDKLYENSLLDTNYFQKNVPTAKSLSFMNKREICGRHKLHPGKYVIIPSTYNPGEEAKFLLRIFSEKPYDSRQMDQETEILECNVLNNVYPDQKKDENNTEKLKQAFLAFSGHDKEIDAFELQKILDTAFQQDFKFNGFSRETCRSLVAMMDTDQSGKLGFEEFKIMWNDLILWKRIFKKFDIDKSGNFNSFEIRQALNHIGFKISNRVYTAVTTRFADRNGIITFDDYILLLVRLKTVSLTYRAQKKTETGDAIFPKDEFIQCVIYL